MRAKSGGLLTSLLFFVCFAHGQGITATISGSVHDPSGAVIAGAAITVVNAEEGLTVRQLTSDSAGQFVVPLLPVGHYEVTAEAPGFQKSVQGGIDLNMNDHRIVDFLLPLRAQSAEVHVSADPLQVDLQTDTAAGLISGTQVRELAINTRNYAMLVALEPGVSSNLSSDQLYVGLSSLNGQGNAVLFSINGSRPDQNNWTLDGADNQERGSKSGLLTFPSVDSIAEFKVLRGNYASEFGRGAGAQISVITRSGTSAYHGGIYEFFRNDVLAANNFFNNLRGLARPPLRYNDFGFTLGGPVAIPHLYKKTFFFYSQEWRRVIDYTTFTTAEVPTPAELQGNFTAPVCTQPVFDPVTGNCTSPTTTHITNIDPTTAAYIKDIFSKLPAPGPDGTFSYTGRNLFDFREESFKIDHTFNTRLSAFLRYTQDSIPTVEPGGLTIGLPLPDTATTDSNDPGRNLTLRITGAATPRLLDEAGYAYSYNDILSEPVGLLSQSLSPDINPTLRFPNLSGRVPTLFFQTGQSLLGFGPFDSRNTNRAVFDNLTWITGPHITKYGFSYNHYVKDEGAYFRTDNGLFAFPSVGPDGPSFQQEWANFLLGNVQSFQQTNVNPTADMHQNQLEFFAQDQYRLRPNITFTYGFRWSFFRQPTEALGHGSNFDPQVFSANSAPAIDITTGLLVPGTSTPVMDGIILAAKNSPFGSAMARQTNRDIAPRVGFAWDPFRTGKTSLRGGYGIFFDAPAMGPFENGPMSNPPFVKTIVITNTTLNDLASVAPKINLTPQPVGGVAVNWKQPYVQQWNLDLQRQLSPTMLLDVGYYGNRGVHLPSDEDINQPLPGAYLSAGVLPQGPITLSNYQLLNYVRPYRGYDAINLFVPAFNSNYHSLQVQLQKRAGENLIVVLNYTWSHSLTDVPDQFNSPQNIYDLHAEYGPSEYDRRHVFNGSYIYQLPFYRSQHGSAGHLLGGWEVSGAAYAQSGLWLTAVGASIDPAGLGLTDFTSDNTGNARPDQLANPNRNAPHTVAQWFNPAVFADPPAQGIRPGDAPRNSILGPGAWRWDASLFKNTRVGERFNTQFRAEATNVLNHTNFDQVGTSFLSDPVHFGQVLTARDPRIIQLALKLSF